MRATFWRRECDAEKNGPPAARQARIMSRPLKENNRLGPHIRASDPAEGPKLIVVAGVWCCGEQHDTATA
jgi:hypothetical protein